MNKIEWFILLTFPVWFSWIMVFMVGMSQGSNLMNDLITCLHLTYFSYYSIFQFFYLGFVWITIVIIMAIKDLYKKGKIKI